MADTRPRSASPERREPKPKKQKTGGFKWKEKKARHDENADEREGGRLERGYRNRSPKRDSYRERDRERDRSPERDSHRDSRRDGEGNRHREHDREARRETDSYRPRDRELDHSRDTGLDRKDTKFDRKDTNSTTNDKPKESQPDKRKDKEKKPKKPKQTAPSEPMIIVNVNDRLGTKAAIPCLASDSVKAFKAIVAAHIGRQPHEILLKRQGERPFKDQLTLEDYGVSNGVQLDLELDTGD